MVDIHCHILPLVDDGARSWEIAEQMCAMAAGDGITHIVATPHANAQFAYNRERFSELLAELQGRINGILKFSLGCDFNLSFENLELLFASPAQFLIQGTRYLLIELNNFGIPPGFDQLLFRMTAELQIVPILTHPERHPLLQRHPEQVVPWTDLGCLVQITANSLTGHWGRRAKDAAVWLLKKNLVHIVASDAHDVRHRPPVLSPAREVVAQILDEHSAMELVETNPSLVVTDGNIA
ncbi:MAG TPA: CpsB/CapC family capsule biosynthesis tyrosine phosphatase [Candidatus Angelobacter sp.]|jgi:protein-tyrosine phosphatase|nr:CpsB/CapC family capsule biosynthesis tyrosine phosphatase [Candidatus Angelobacter sp.]